MLPRPHILIVPFSAALIALLTLPALAQQILPAPRLQSVFPLGGKAGSDFEFVLVGDMLEGRQELVFSHPGIKAEPVMTPADAFYPEARPARDRFTVKIAAEVPPGAYEVRVANGMGVSNARAFFVGDLPESSEREPAEQKDEKQANDRPDQAEDVAVNSVVNGRCDPRGHDYFKFTAKAGQRLIIHCAARRADSYADAVLTLYDAAGKVLAKTHDAVRLDPVLDFTVPADGQYVVSVHDFLYKGGERYPYRLTIGTGPWVDFVDPPFAAPGAADKHTVYGRNLPGSSPAGPGAEGLEKLDVTIQAAADPSQAPAAVDTLLRPTEAALHSFSYRLKAPNGLSNPVRMALVAGSGLPEQADNDSADKAQPLTLPATLLSRWEKRDDRDWYSFQAKKGDKVWIEVTSQRLGLPTDASLVVQHVSTDEEGKTVVSDVAEADDPMRLNDINNLEQHYRDRGDDPSLLLECPRDGTYRVLVRDLYGSAQGGTRFVYLLTVRPGEPDFHLLAYAARRDPEGEQNTYTATVLRKGGAVQIDVLALRREGFDGEIKVTAEGLPPGVTVSPAVVGPWSEFAAVVLTAAADAPDFAGPIKVIGRATVKGAEAVRYARSTELAEVQNQQNPRPILRVVEHMALAVRADLAPPFALQAGPGPDGNPQVFRTARGGKLSIPIKSTRAAGFAGGIRVRQAGLHPQMRTQEFSLDGGTAERAMEIDTDPSAPTGKFTFVVRGDTSVKYKRSPDVSKQAEDDKARIDAATQKANEDSQKANQNSQQAEQTAQQAVALMNRAEQQRDQSAQQSEQANQRLGEAEAKAAEAKAAFETADAEAKKAAEALASAQASARQAAAGADEAAKQAANQAAQQAANAAAEAQQQANQAKAVMDQAAQQAVNAATQAKTAADALTKMTEAKAAADVKVTETQAAHEQAAEAATKAREYYEQAERTRQRAEEWFRQTREFGQERDLRVVFPSPPIAVEIVEAPFALTLGPAPTVKAGGEPAEVSATIVPEFGFADEVRFDLLPPEDVGGMNFTDKGNMLAKGAAQGKLLVQVAQNVKPGAYACRVRARYRFNSRDMSIERPLTVTVTPADQKK